MYVLNVMKSPANSAITDGNPNYILRGAVYDVYGRGLVKSLLILMVWYCLAEFTTSKRYLLVSVYCVNCYT